MQAFEALERGTVCGKGYTKRLFEKVGEVRLLD